MTISIGGDYIPIAYPIEGNESFQERFLKLFDGQATNIGGTTTLTTGGSANQVWYFDSVTGSKATLPNATGSLMKIRFYVQTLATSNSHIIYTASGNSGAGTETFQGLIYGANTSSNAVLGFAAGATQNTITLNRTTTGSVSLGEFIDVQDVASGKWLVFGMLSALTANFQTPFSHT